MLAGVLGMIGLSLQTVSMVLTALAILFVCIALYLVMADRPNRLPAMLALAFAALMLAYRLYNLPPVLRYLGTFGFAAALIVRAIDRLRRLRRAKIPAPARQS
jgi:hypothetical protein